MSTKGLPLLLDEVVPYLKNGKDINQTGFAHRRMSHPKIRKK